MSSLLLTFQCRTLTGSRYVCFFGQMGLVRVKNITFAGLVRQCLAKSPRNLFAGPKHQQDPAPQLYPAGIVPHGTAPRAWAPRSCCSACPHITIGGLVHQCPPELWRNLSLHAETPTRPRTSIIPRRYSPAWRGSTRMGPAINLLRMPMCGT